MGRVDKDPADRSGRRRPTTVLPGQYLSTAITSALTLAAAFAIGFYGGQWLDRRLGTAPWLTLIGLGLGVTAGFRTVLRELIPDLFAPKPKSQLRKTERGEAPSDNHREPDAGRDERP